MKFAIMDSVQGSVTAVADASSVLRTTGFELKRSSESNNEKTIYVAYSWDFDDTNSNNDVQNQGQTFTISGLTITAEQIKAATD